MTPDPTVPTDALSVRRALFLRQFERERREREQDTSTPIRFLSDGHRIPTSSVPTGEDRGIGGDLAPSALPGHDRTEGEERADPFAPAPHAALSTTESVLPPHVAHTTGSDTHGIPTADVQHTEVETHDAAPRTGTAHHAPRADDDLRRTTLLPQSTPSGLAPLVIPSTSRQLDILRARGNGVPLEPRILRHMEANMRVPLGDMRIHNDPDAWTLCQRLGAQAFADGTDIYFQKGAYQPGTPQGRNLLGRQLQRAVAWRTEQQAKEAEAARAAQAPVARATEHPEGAAPLGPETGVARQHMESSGVVQARAEVGLARTGVSVVPSHPAPRTHSGA